MVLSCPPPTHRVGPHLIGVVDFVDVLKNIEGLLLSLGDQQKLGALGQDREQDGGQHGRDRAHAGEDAPGDVGLAVGSLDRVRNDGPCQSWLF